jgi:hypothetical protein
MDEQDLEQRREQERAPVEQAGGGESEGFEQAEQQLERNASHEDAGGSPTQDAFTPEVEADRSTAEYSESDQLPEEAPEEVVEDDAGGEARDDAEDSPGAADSG